MTISVRRQAFVDLTVLVENLARASASPTGSPELTIVDVRGDAYGHGLLAVAQALAAAGATGFLVSRSHDAVALDAVGIHSSVLASALPAQQRVVGSRLYGLDPLDAAPCAFRLIGEVIAVKQVPADRGVSYGYTYRTIRPTTLALVALGFADGIPRVASNRAPVRIGDFTGRVTGRIAMDQFVVDLDGNTAAVGDEVVLFGDPTVGDPSVHQWADATGLAAEVILSRLGRRIERVYAQ